MKCIDLLKPTLRQSHLELHIQKNNMSYQKSYLIQVQLTAIYETTVKLGYSNIGFCDTLSIASNIQWYELIPHKATVFIPCLL
jgi:hypothetical protein